MHFDTSEHTAGMEHAPKTILKIVAFLSVAAAIIKAVASPSITLLAGVTPEMLAPVIGPIIADSVPRQFEGKKDWGKTTPIHTFHADGKPLKFDIHQTKDVNDGVWKRYKLALIDPEHTLTVRIDRLQPLETGGYALSLFVAAKIHGWAQAVVYEKGVHIITIDAEGDTAIRLTLDANVEVATVSSLLFVPGIELHPKITAANLKFDEFKLTKISDIKGFAANDLGGLLRHALEKELSGPKLVEKLNHSFEKHPDKLKFSPDKLLGVASDKPKNRAGNQVGTSN
jgi:hypothetical protein